MGFLFYLSIFFRSRVDAFWVLTRKPRQIGTHWSHQKSKRGLTGGPPSLFRSCFGHLFWLKSLMFRQTFYKTNLSTNKSTSKKQRKCSGFCSQKMVKCKSVKYQVSQCFEHLVYRTNNPGLTHNNNDPGCKSDSHMSSILKTHLFDCRGEIEFPTIRQLKHTVTLTS